jgi:hypothetical protein
MSTSVPELQSATAVSVNVTKDKLSVELSDGRTIAAPVAWFPRLRHGSMAERRRWQISGAGMGIHWPELDEDICVEGLLLGRPSGESQASLRRWLEQRKSSKSGNGSRTRRKK